MDKSGSLSRRLPLIKPRLLLYWLAVALLSGGIFAATSGFVATKHAQALVQASSGVSVERPSDQAVRAYATPPLAPKYIDLPKLGVHARVDSLGVDSKGQLRAPSNVFDTGWYNQTALPGQLGNLLLDGHISIGKTKGVFYNITTLKPGDLIVISTGNNRLYNYKVTGVSTVSAASVNMGALVFSDKSKATLSLISCAGRIVANTGRFEKRVIVSATLLK